MPRDDGKNGYGVVEEGSFGRRPLGCVMTCIVAQQARESGYDVVCVNLFSCDFGKKKKDFV